MEASWGGSQCCAVFHKTHLGVGLCFTCSSPVCRMSNGFIPTYSRFGAAFRAVLGVIVGLTSMGYSVVFAPFVFAFTERDPRLSYPVVRSSIAHHARRNLCTLACGIGCALCCCALQVPCDCACCSRHGGCAQVSPYVPAWLLAIVCVPVPIAMYIIAYAIVPMFSGRRLSRYALCLSCGWQSLFLTRQCEQAVVAFVFIPHLGHGVDQPRHQRCEDSLWSSQTQFLRAVYV